MTAVSDARVTGQAGQDSYSFAAAPGGLPVLGHTLPLLRDPLEFLKSLPSRGDLIGLRLGPKRAYLAAHPGLAMRVLLEARTFDKGGPLFETYLECFENIWAAARHYQAAENS